MVAREGLEPSKPLGRQIYSLLRLTASLPRQLCVLSVDFERSPQKRLGDGAGEGIRTPDLLITNQLLYRPELRQHKRCTLARPVPAAQLVGPADNGRASGCRQPFILYGLARAGNLRPQSLTNRPFTGISGIRERSSGQCPFRWRHPPST